MNYSPFQLLSHSSLQEYRLCNRKFELSKIAGRNSDSDTIHTVFGKSLGDGIQALWKSKNLAPQQRLEAGIFQAFKSWNPLPLDAFDVKARKSFDMVYFALEKYNHQEFNTLKDFELAYLKNGKPACEVSFAVTLPKGYLYRGFIDAVLYNPSKNLFSILELKTTGGRFISEASYSNSFQGVGYGIILDKIPKPQTGAISSYDVLYQVYKTQDCSFELMPFRKTMTTKIKWINDLLIFIEDIEKRRALKRFPQNGDACMSFGRACKFYDTCNYENESIFQTNIIPVTQVNLDDFDYVFTLEELIRTQME